MRTAPPDWVRHLILWHVYPLGATGAYPDRDDPGRGDDGDGDGDDGDGDAGHRLRRLLPWLEHVQRLGANGLLLGPVFASGTHGYDTTDHFRVDPRLGDDADLDALVATARTGGIRVVLDGVFHHVGAEHPWARAARDDPDGPAAARFRHTPDGAIATFEGHPGLLALDHTHPEVADHVVAVMDHWLDRGVDGWRLDAAYAVPDGFWAEVLPRVRARHPDAWFVGEVIHGDHDAIAPVTTIDSLTAYELWKAIWSSLNDGNPHELAWALGRHDRFAAAAVPQTFVGNHDVTRIASRLDDPRHLPLALAVLATVPGVPTVYAGDEFGLTGVKEDRAGGDDAVRPELPATPPPGPDPEILRLHQELLGLRRRHPWLHDAGVEVVDVGPAHLVFDSRAAGEGSGGSGRLRVTLDYGDGGRAPSWRVDPT